MLVRRKNTDYRSREYLTVREVNSILRAAKLYGRHKVRNYALILLIFRHGLRVSEACELRWDAISLAYRYYILNNPQDVNLTGLCVLDIDS